MKKKSIVLIIILLTTSLSFKAQEKIDSTFSSIPHSNYIRFQFLSPIKGALGLEYERFFNPQFSLLAEGAIIGINESEVVSRNCSGFYAGLGGRMYGPDFKANSISKRKSSLRSSFYGTARFAFESYKGTFVPSDLFSFEASPENYDYNRSISSLFFGAGYSLHVLEYVNLDMGLAVGYLLVNNSSSESPEYNKARIARNNYHHGVPLSGNGTFSGKLWINLGVNF